jgi:hypothetical protein
MDWGMWVSSNSGSLWVVPKSGDGVGGMSCGTSEKERIDVGNKMREKK